MVLSDDTVKDQFCDEILKVLGKDPFAYYRQTILCNGINEHEENAVCVMYKGKEIWVPTPLVFVNRKDRSKIFINMGGIFEEG